MPARKFAAAVVFALLAAVPAHAANVDALSLTFASGATFSGTLTFNSDYSEVTAVNGAFSASSGLLKPGLNGGTLFIGAPLVDTVVSQGAYPGSPLPTDKYHQLHISNSGGVFSSHTDIYFVYSNLFSVPRLFDPSGGVDWVIASGVAGFDGSVAGSLTPVSSVPLPDALPLFAVAFFGLGAFAVQRRSRRVL